MRGLYNNVQSCFNRYGLGALRWLYHWSLWHMASDLLLPSQPWSIWHMHVNNLTEVVTWKWNGQDSNPRPFESRVQHPNHCITRPRILKCSTNLLFTYLFLYFTCLFRQCNSERVRFRDGDPVPYCVDGCHNYTHCGDVIVPADHLDVCLLPCMVKLVDIRLHHCHTQIV